MYLSILDINTITFFIFKQININSSFMTININNQDIELRYSLRIFLIYENITKSSLDYNNITMSNLIDLFYATIIGTLQHAKKDFIKYEDYLDWLDENGGEKILADFSTWFLNTILAQQDIADNNIKEEKQKDETKQEKN